MEDKESILSYIEKHIQKNGILSEDFSLAKYKQVGPNELQFADGMIDYNFYIEKDEDVFKLLIETMKNLEDTEENLMTSLNIIDNYYSNNPQQYILGTIEDFLQLIIEDFESEVHQFSDVLIHQWALYMMLFGKEIETVKIGIALMGLFKFEEKDERIELLEKLSLSDEFTKYTNITLGNAPNANEIKFRLVKKVFGYGKIVLEEDLEPDTEEIREWLLCNGCTVGANNVELAINIAKKINIVQMIRERNLSEDEFEGVYNIIQPMIEEVSQKKMSEYEEKKDLFMEIAKQYKNFKNSILYLELIVLIKNYCENENLECEASFLIKEIINSNEVKQFILSEIEKENELYKYVFVSTSIDDFNIYENIFNAFKKNVKQNMSCLEYLFNNTKNVNEILEVLRKNIDLQKMEGDPEPIIDFNVSIDLIMIIQCLEEYPFYGEDFVITGLKSKTMHPRNTALRTINEWKKKTKKGINELSEELKSAIVELKEKEIIKPYKEMINTILEIEEDLSNYEEPKVKYGLEKEKSTGIGIFEKEIDSLFDDIIRVRGKDYYKNNMIHYCDLTNSKYVAYVQGTKFSTEYKTVISVNKENEIIEMDCNCPYPNNCKHEYATLLYIRNKYNK